MYDTFSTLNTTILTRTPKILSISKIPDTTNTTITTMDLQLGLFEPQQSIESTESDQDPMESACDRALAINEILHVILSCVPKENLANIRRVSKTWNSVGHSIGYHVDPILEQTEHPGCPAWYADTIPIAFHPTLTPPFKLQGIPSFWHYYFEISLDCKFRAAIFTKLGDQFLTSPPVSQIQLCGVAWKDGGGHAVLHMPDGVLFRDVGEAVRRLGVVDAYGECSGKKCEGHKLGIGIHCAKGQQKGFPLSMRLRLWRAELALKMRD